MERSHYACFVHVPIDALQMHELAGQECLTFPEASNAQLVQGGIPAYQEQLLGKRLGYKSPIEWVTVFMRKRGGFQRMYRGERQRLKAISLNCALKCSDQALGCWKTPQVELDAEFPGADCRNEDFIASVSEKP
mgnify:CR=1 FL=1